MVLLPKMARVGSNRLLSRQPGIEFQSDQSLAGSREKQRTNR
jgi:hypothetical protein